MKTRWMIMSKYSPWLLAMLAMELFFCVLLWVADVQAFLILSTVLTLGTFLLFASVLLVVWHHEQKKRTVFENYVSAPNELYEEMLIELCSKADEASIRFLGDKLRSQQQENDAIFFLSKIMELE